MPDAILCRCEICDVAFKFNKHKANRVCSMTCYRALQRAGAYKRGHGPDYPSAPCAQCQATVLRFNSVCRDGSKSEKVFCDRGCYDAFRSGLRALKSKPCPCCKSPFIGDTQQVYCGVACQKKDKKAKPRNCVNCQCFFTPVRLSPSGIFISQKAAKTCCRACHIAWISNNEARKLKIGIAFSGDKHPNWQGGKSQLNNVSNRGPNWSKQRLKALKRDGDLCGDCGITAEQCREKYGRGLDVDHKVPYHNFSSYKRANVLSNLQSLCASCHRIAEAKRSMIQMVLPMQDSLKRQHKSRSSKRT